MAEGRRVGCGGGVEGRRVGCGGDVEGRMVGVYGGRGRDVSLQHKLDCLLI